MPCQPEDPDLQIIRMIKKIIINRGKKNEQRIGYYPIHKIKINKDWIIRKMTKCPQ